MQYICTYVLYCWSCILQYAPVAHNTVHVGCVPRHGTVSVSWIVTVTLIARLFDYWLAQLSLYSLPAAGTEAIDGMPVENVSLNYPMECTVQGVMCVRTFVHCVCLVIQCL